MQVDKDTGLLEGVTWVESPNCDERPAGCPIDLVVVHGISLPPGEFGGPEISLFFTNQLDFAAHPFYTEIEGVQVSSHLLIRRDGEIIQYVPFTRRAWHAGVSCFGDRQRCNDFSIGIELEGTDDLPYEDVQYRQLAEVIRALQQAYPDIDRNRVVGHCDIAPGRKTDPGQSFDWQVLRTELDKG